MKFRLLVFGLVVSVSGLAQQPCECILRGMVRDTLSKEGIAGVVVSIPALKRGVLTDQRGSYLITGLCPTTYEIETRLIGYKPRRVVVSLRHTDNQRDFSLSEEAHHLESIDIVAERIESLSKAVEVTNRKAILERSGESLAQILERTAGVAMLQTGHSIAKPVIHGMHSNRVVIFTNGVRLESQQWGTEHAPEIDPASAHKISVIKGASGVRYGADAIAGIIKIEPLEILTSKPRWEATQTYFTNGRQLSTNVAVLQPLIKDKLGLRVGGTWKRGGDITTPTYRLANTGLAEFNVEAGLAYDRQTWKWQADVSQFNSQIGIFSGSHLGNTTDLLAAINRSKPLEQYTPEKFSYAIARPYQDLQHSIVKIKSIYEPSTRFLLETTAARQQNFRREVDVLRGDRNLVQQFQLVSYQLEMVGSWRHTPVATTEFGWQATNQQNVSTGKLTSPARSSVIIPNYESYTVGAFITTKKQWSKFEAEAGLRAESRWMDVFYLTRQSNPQHDFHRNRQVVGTFGTSYAPTASINLFTTLSTAWRPPSVNEWYSDGVHHGTASYELGNSQLKPERAINAVLGVQFTFSRVKSEVSAYQHAISNYIFLAPTGQGLLTIRGAFPLFKYVQTDALYRGLDWMASFAITSKWYIEHKLSLLKATDTRNLQPLYFIPPNRNLLKIGFAPKGKFLQELSLEHQLVTRQTRYPSQNLFADTAEAFPNVGGDFLPPPPAYQLFNAFATFRLHTALSATFTAKNIFNTSYRDYLNRFRYFTDEIGRNLQFRIHYTIK